MTNKERIQKNNLDIADCIDLVGTGGGGEAELAELVVTRNGVYDDPIAISEVNVSDIVVGCKLQYREVINLSESLKDKLRGYCDGDYFELNRCDGCTTEVNVYSDGAYFISGYGDCGDHIYVSEDIIEIRGEDPWYGLTASGWYVYNSGTGNMEPCDPPMLTVESEYTTNSGTTNIELLRLLAGDCFLMANPVDGWNKVTVDVPSDIVDVDELPTKNVDRNKIYKVTDKGEAKDATEIWIVDSMGALSLSDFIKIYSNIYGELVTKVHVVDSLPQIGELGQQYDSLTDTTICNYYVIANDPTSEAWIYMDRGFGDCGWWTFSEWWWWQYNGTITDLTNVTEQGYYIVNHKVSESIVKYGIPDDSNNKSVFEYSDYEGWKECDFVVDVNELPAENINHNKIYKVAGASIDATEIWFALDEEVAKTYGTTNPIGLNYFEWFEYGPGSVNIHVVDSLPEVGEISDWDDSDRYISHYYITPNDPYSGAYVYSDGRWITFSEWWWGLPYNGTVTDIESVTQEGYYIVNRQTSTDTIYGIPNEDNNKSVFEYTTEGGWKKRDVIVDVDELPTENVDDNTVYRVANIEPGAEIYVKRRNYDVMELGAFMRYRDNRFEKIERFIVHRIDSSSDFDTNTVIPGNSLGPELHVYLLTDTGDILVDFDGYGVRSLLFEYIGIYTDVCMGVITSPSELSSYNNAYGYIPTEFIASSVYGIPNGDSAKTYKDGDWTDLVDAGIPNGKPVEISTSAGMDEILANATDADTGTCYFYTGKTTANYITNTLYVIHKEED